MNNVKVKICGITNCDDAINASNAGADAFGYVFYKDSPRFCSIEQAIQINRILPPFITKVGLFVNPEAEFVRSVISENVIDIIQFHGSETPEFCSSFKFPFIKVISVKKDTNIEKICDDFVDASAILLDTFDTDHFGGTGKSFDWSLIPRNLKKPIIIAGGLTPDNVSTLIKEYQPYAVDVSGGVESETKGKKSEELMKQFIKVVKNG